MWEAHLKLKFIGKWWKISLLCNLAKLLRLETQFYSGGTERGDPIWPELVKMNALTPTAPESDTPAKEETD